MSDGILPPGVHATLRAVRLRASTIHALGIAMPGAGLLLLLHRWTSPALLVLGVVLLLAAFAALTLRAWRRLNPRWLARGLNARLPALEDSAELLLADTVTLPPLAALQRARIASRLDAAVLPDLRPAYPRKRLLLAGAAGVALAVLAYGGDALRRAITLHQGAVPATSADAAFKAHIRAVPPAYTDLPEQQLDGLDLRAPAGSTLEFSFTTAQQPAALTMAFADGRKLQLQQQDGHWNGTLALDASALYRLDSGSADTTQPLHRLEALPDHPPEVTVKAPDKTLNLLAEQQKTWDLSFEASDDYGLGPAELSISLAQGSGDNVKTTERKLVLDGKGGARKRSYTTSLDLAALGYSRGDDLIVRLSVADNHQPLPNITRSASFILRWPEQAMKQGSGVEGPMQNAAPAFFRSERQIIIDTEALLAERGGLAQERFATRADSLGVDQKMLRLRYGQFLGEEFESNAEHDPRKPQEVEGVDHGAPAAAHPFGQEADTVREYGHIHDIAEATTLLDPETRRILKSALDEMWQAEQNLRQALPDQALPYEHKALDYIKQVQQAERIYLARAGLELPQPDLTRRLSGDRAGLGDRDTAATAAQTGDGTVSALYAAASSSGTVDAAALQQWLAAHPDAASSAIGLTAAADKLQHDPACQTCRAELRTLLWPLLPPPPTALTPRSAATPAGNAYLDALSVPAPEPPR